MSSRLLHSGFFKYYRQNWSHKQLTSDSDNENDIEACSVVILVSAPLACVGGYAVATDTPLLLVRMQGAQAVALTADQPVVWAVWTKKVDSTVCKDADIFCDQDFY